MTRMNPFRIDHRGHYYSGTWEVDGKEVLVSSAWGSDREPLGRRKPEKVAAGISREIVARRGQ